MSTHPYLPLYVDDYDAHTAHLSAEEDGVYMRLLRLAWRTPGCSLPNDPAWIARKIRLSAADFERVAKPVIEEFFKVKRGRLVQGRLKDEYDDISRKKAARKEAGKKGGSAKALKTQENVSSNATVLPADTRAFPNPEPEPEDKNPPKPPQGGKQEGDLFGEGPPPAKRDRRKPQRAIPDDFPSADLIDEQRVKALASGANIDARYQAERFRGWALGRDARYADWPATWRNWMAKAINEAPKTAILAASAPPEDPAAVWTRRIKAYRQNGYWNRLDWGDAPGKPGCTVPADVLMANGYVPPPTRQEQAA